MNQVGGTGMKTGWGRGVMALGAALALAWSGTAQAACIDEPVVGAARLHEFEMLMMDVSLHCTRMGVAMQAHYDTMISVHHVLFEQAVQRLQHFFAIGTGAETHHGGLYDRYATLIANRYGGGNTSFDACRVFDGVAVEVAKAGDGGRMLGAVAQAMIAHPLLESATCPAIAAAAPPKP
jgi:hypothetical protein